MDENRRIPLDADPCFKLVKLDEKLFNLNEKLLKNNTCDRRIGMYDTMVKETPMEVFSLGQVRIH